MNLELDRDIRILAKKARELREYKISAMLYSLSALYLDSETLDEACSVIHQIITKRQKEILETIAKIDTMFPDEVSDIDHKTSDIDYSSYEQTPRENL